MDLQLFVGLINNAALLMALIIVSELTYVINFRSLKVVPYINGVLIGLIGLAIMMIPFNLAEGIFFDTRTILISVTALTFGPVTALISSAILILYRILLGGAGVFMGTGIIIASALIGILWRRYFLNCRIKNRWLNIYLFGIIVHLSMLACTILLPEPASHEVLREIGLPVMVIYPAGTVLLSMLLLRQKERKESLLQIKEAEAKYTSIFNNNHACMLVIDPETAAIVDANPAAAKFYGWSVEELKSMKITQINLMDEPTIRANMENSIRMKQNHFIFRHKTAYGRDYDVEIYTGPIMIQGKQLIYTIIHDISERAAATKALRESEERFRLLIESAPEAIFIQAGGRFTFVNQFAATLIGASSEEELIDTAVLDRIHTDCHELVHKRLFELMEEKKSVSPIEEIFLKLDGTPIDVDVTAVPIHYAGVDGVLVFARDITDRKKLKAEKRAVEAQLRQQQKMEAIGTLAGGVAHEINNPINGIMNYAQLILDAEKDSDSATAVYAGEIIHETERIAVIVKNLLQFSRQEKQSHSYANIYDIIDQTISLIKTVVKRDQITLELDLEENLPDIKCRSQQIQQVLMNLLTNARDALNEKYPEYHEDKIIYLNCVQFSEDDRRWIRITVEDHGNGIPKDMAEKIFEPFFSTKPKDVGTGLGLSISFGIVKDHHGKIEIDSIEGCYTKFILTLPVDNGWNL